MNPLETLKEDYRNLRTGIESYLKNKHSKKVAKNMEQFYEENFADSENTESLDAGHVEAWSSGRKVASIEQNMKKIPRAASKLEIPVIELAGFCFIRLFEDATREFLSEDYMIANEYEGMHKRIMRDTEDGELAKQMLNTYQVSYYKLELAKEMAEKFKLGSDEKQICSRNLERIKERVRIIEIIKEALEDGRKEEATKAFEELVEIHKEEVGNVSKELTALTKEDVGKWFAED